MQRLPLACHPVDRHRAREAGELVHRDPLPGRYAERAAVVAAPQEEVGANAAAQRKRTFSAHDVEAVADVLAARLRQEPDLGVQPPGQGHAAEGALTQHQAAIALPVGKVQAVDDVIRAGGLAALHQMRE